VSGIPPEPHARRADRRAIVRLAGGCSVIALAVLSGCSRSDGLTSVSGRVTFRGEPVPRGDVFIEPDASQGNIGPQCRSSIIDGEFQSRPRYGSVQGPVIVVVEGFHTPPESDFAVPLFPRHEFKTEIPKGKTSLDIIVPDAPAPRQGKSPGGR
jgi:hypothetical protein